VYTGCVFSAYDHQDHTLIRLYALLDIDVDVCWEYSRALRYLSDNGMRHFARVPRLQIVDYTAPAD